VSHAIEFQLQTTIAKSKFFTNECPTQLRKRIKIYLATNSQPNNSWHKFQ
jgi:hypothetical protein